MLRVLFMIINTWIGPELVTLDTEDIWIDVFLEWDTKVDSITAQAIANAVVTALEQSQEGKEGTNGI